MRVVCGDFVEDVEWVFQWYPANGRESGFGAVLPDGLQQISPVLAAILRNANSYGLDQPPRLGPDKVAKLPVSRQLDTSRYPDGGYMLEVEASDVRGNRSTDNLAVTFVNANQNV